jgi:predicted NBD/HSP70 family sugar kinase
MPSHTRPIGRIDSRADSRAAAASAAVGVVTRGTAPRVEGAKVADSGRRAASAGAVLRTALDHGPIARSTIARITGLSPASVTSHTTELARLGLLREFPDSVRSNGAGRPHIPVDVDVARHLVVGVHIAVQFITTSLLDLRGRVLARLQTPHDSTDPACIVERVARDIDSLYATHVSGAQTAEAGEARLLGIGVATGGWVDPDAGVVMDHPRLGWSLVPLRDLLAARTGLPVHVDGHSRALLHGEVLFGRASRVGSVLHVFVGNVVDAAFATRGEAHYGSRAQAGAIAHLPVEDSREPCSCGRTGCLEAAVSERTITRRAHELGIIPAPDIRLLLGAAREGNRAAIELFVERARLVGRAVALLMDVFGPELAIVMDPALPYLPPALDALRAAARQNVRTVCDIDSMLIPTSFPGAVLETAGGAVFLDALYRDPLGFSARLAESAINSEDCNVDTAGRLR